LNHFADKVALVAGGTGALGREVSLALLAAGARVTTTYRQRAEFDTLIADARGASAGQVGALTGVEVDTTDASAVAKMLANLAGDVDILIDAVGAFSGGKNVWEEDPANYERMMALNLKSGFLLARAVLPRMIRQNRGWIVNVASRAGYGHSGGAALYSASKAGALALFDSLAEEVKPYAINVNSVVPSIFDTPANRRAMPSADYTLWPKPADIARVILFLCSPEARVIHGAAIPVYGRT
jgi:NAD(P)-dependent dehydrogenase (short-subunit alcohol dehydrogenase family)